MVLNPHGIKPTFLKLNLWSPGEDFIPFITSNAIYQIRLRKKECAEKICYMHTTKHLTNFL